MQEARIPVTFEPGQKTVHVLRGTKLLEAAGEAGLVLDVPCGGEGRCGKCRVVVSAGVAEPSAVESSVFSAEELRAGCRLACQSEVLQPMAVCVPEASLVGSGHQILVASAATAETPDDPVVSKRYVELPPPARGSDDPDPVRLEKAIGRFQADLDLMHELPGRLRHMQFRGTAVLCEGRLLDFESGNTQWEAYGVALDLGTTTLAATLLDLGTGRQVAVASRLNPQTRFGDDVLSRILHAREQLDGLGELQKAVVAAVDEMIGQLCAEAAIARERVYAVSVAGNTTMQQMLAGIDPRWLGEVPFVPALGRGLSLRAREVGLRIHPRGRIYLLPVIGGFVGGDTVAGILATGLADCPAPTLLVDIGTNGEVALAANGRLSAASTAAGPAFEGARISQGMRAATGAIEKVKLDGGVSIEVIGNVPPLGLCGSALIDAAAELLRHGLVTPQGRMLPPGELPPGLSPELAQRVVLVQGRPAFVLADEREAAGGRPVLLTQQDIRELQLAAGAIRAGIGILLQRAGIEPGHLDRVLLGGGFGNFIRRKNTQRIGLLPCGIEHHRIRYQGNTSLAGARLVTLSRSARKLADDLAERCEHVDLSFDPGFHAAFAEAMIFPEA